MVKTDYLCCQRAPKLVNPEEAILVLFVLTLDKFLSWLMSTRLSPQDSFKSNGITWIELYLGYKMHTGKAKAGFGRPASSGQPVGSAMPNYGVTEKANM